ncbi:MAG TPA: hypothetical protein GXX15_05745 [Clostridia bacterium]|nr:hypothetical protein [Clostridia bacterium]
MKKKYLDIFLGILFIILIFFMANRFFKDSEKIVFFKESWNYVYNLFEKIMGLK